MATYAPGMPCWADLGSPDLEASRAFYGGLFGWSAEMSPEPEAGGYTTFLLDGKGVAAVGPLMGEDQPPVWTTYFASDDADATAASVADAGGTVIVAPMPVLNFGRFAICSDPAGAVFGVWQRGSMAGADVVGEPGSMGWNELTTRDVDGSKTFYGSVFAWKYRDVPYEGVDYTLFEVDDRAAAGLMPMVGDLWPPDLPPHWMLYFNVEDTDAAAAKAASLGGTVSILPTDTPAGRLAVLGDPHGAFFSIIKPNADYAP